MAARIAVAEYYQQQFGAVVEPQQVLLTASTSEAYSYCLKLIASPGSSVLIPQPSYPLLHFLLEAEGITPKPYFLHPVAGEWLLDRDSIRSAIDSNTKAIILVHPNNPTGHFLSPADIEWLIETTRNQLWLISDEVFCDYRWSSTTTQLSSLTALGAGNCFTLSGLSKICALPQMKLGWIVAPADSVLQSRLELVADTYLSVSAPIQAATPGWLQHRAQFQKPIQERCRENLLRIPAALQGSPWAMLPVEAGWMAILKGPVGIDEESIALSLLQSGISVHPGYYYDLPFQPSLVLSLLTPWADLEPGLKALTSS